MVSIGHYIPCYRHPVPEVLTQVANEARKLTSVGIDYRMSQDEFGHITIARNRAVKAAIDAGLDYLVMQDSDVWCPDDDGAILRMLETLANHHATCVAAICGLRQNPPRPSVEPARMGEVYKAERAGAGLILIDIARIKGWGMEGGWFMDVYTDDGMGKKVGQDIFFSRLIEEQGGELWVDGRIATHHSQRDSMSLFYPGTDANRERESRA